MPPRGIVASTLPDGHPTGVKISDPLELWSWRLGIFSLRRLRSIYIVSVAGKIAELGQLHLRRRILLRQSNSNQKPRLHVEQNLDRVHRVRRKVLPMPATGSRSIDPQTCLLTARQALEHVAAPGEAIRGAVIATQEIIKAAFLVDDISLAFPDLSKSISQQLRAACPIVTAAAGNLITPAQIWFGLGRVNDLVCNGPSPERSFALNHAIILQAELAIALHRAHLIKHGRESMSGALALLVARAGAARAR